MSKNKIVSILPQTIVVTGALLLYATTNFFCIGNCPSFVFGRIDPLYAAAPFLLPTVLCLFFFSWSVFVLWTKHIAWWFSIFTMLAITNFGGGSFLNPSRNEIAIYCMSLFFIITFIYALVMNKKLKGNS